jgi:5-methylcytosine-specific restriction endonuclease McrA
METGVFWALGAVSDEQLRTGLATLLASGARTEARIVAHLAEVIARKLYLRDGSASAFDYCQTRLELSASEAFHRLTAANVARKFPIVFTLLERREIHLTGVCLLRDYLTPTNHCELFRAASHKTKLQILELLARRFPRPDVESRIRKLPSPARRAASADSPLLGAAGPQATALTATRACSETPEGPLTRAASSPTLVSSPALVSSPTLVSSPALVASPRAVVDPLSESRYRIQLNASVALKDKLELLRSLLSHAIPSGDLAEVVERAVELALEHVQKQRFAKTERPRSSRTRMIKRSVQQSPGAQRTAREHIPHSTQRAVAERDGLRCTYLSDDGHRCTARSFLQFHHERPWACGGESTAENLRMLCAAHNALLAERDFGAAHIAERKRARRQRADSCAKELSASGAQRTENPSPVIAPRDGSSACDSSSIRPEVSPIPSLLPRTI